jgi:hypothetical protein
MFELVSFRCSVESNETSVLAAIVQPSSSLIVIWLVTTTLLNYEEVVVD